MREAMETALQDRTAAPAELTVTWEEVCRYLDSLAARGRRRETIQVYRPKLEAFYHFLPEDKRVAADTLELWRAALLREGYSPGWCGCVCSTESPGCGAAICWPIWGGGICS